MNLLILISGYPGTGKTYMANKILENHRDVVSVSLDDIKEKMWDKYGFDNIDEKNRLIEMAKEMYFNNLEDCMKLSKDVISDYPFSDKQKSKLETMIDRYAYRVITIRLTGDLDVLFERQAKRDLQKSRHYGHVSNHYHLGEVYEDRSSADALLGVEEFKNRCLNRGYGSFFLGDLHHVDVTCFDKIDYDEINDFVDRKIGE